MLHNDQTVCLSFKVWSQTIYIYIAVFGGGGFVCVSMTVAIYSTKSTTFLRMKEVVRN